MKSSMPSEQYKSIIEGLGLLHEGESQHKKAGLWLGVSPRTSQGYALGEYPVPEPTAKLLRLCARLMQDCGERVYKRKWMKIMSPDEDVK